MAIGRAREAATIDFEALRALEAWRSRAWWAAQMIEDTGLLMARLSETARQMIRRAAIIVEESDDPSAVAWAQILQVLDTLGEKAPLIEGRRSRRWRIDGRFY